MAYTLAFYFKGSDEDIDLLVNSHKWSHILVGSQPFPSLGTYSILATSDDKDFCDGFLQSVPFGTFVAPVNVRQCANFIKKAYYWYEKDRLNSRPLPPQPDEPEA